MLLSSVYINTIFILLNLKCFIECDGKRQTVCLKELNVFSVPKTTANSKLCRFYIFIWLSNVFCFNNDKLIDVCLNQVLLLFLTASSDTRPSICSSNSGCCNKTIEDEMKIQITKTLMSLTRGHNERARREFKNVHDDLEGMNIQPYIYN